MTLTSVHPTVSYLVKCYVSGISALQRAVIYLVVITYLSFTSTGTESNSFLANTKNPLNQYFVKYAWGWTFSAVCLLMVLTNYISTDSWVSIRTIRSFCRLAVGTAVWYVFTQVIFLFLEEATGVCEVSEFLKKKTCSKAGHFWRGFDTSGHCFLLSWNNLFMVEEFKALLKLNITPVTTVTQHGEGDKKENQKSNKQQSQVNSHLQSELATYLEYLSCGLAVLTMLGEVMMVCTSLYFHSLPEKVLGTLCGLLPWFVMYRRVYQGSWHPGHTWEVGRCD